MTNASKLQRSPRKMRKLVLIPVTITIISSLIARPCFAGGPLRKLGRGLVNILTGIVEIPKKVILTTRKRGAAQGLTSGFVEGAKEGLVRTASGLYEIMTFPIPSPADYEPMVSPEFVFEEWETTEKTPIK